VSLPRTIFVADREVFDLSQGPQLFCFKFRSDLCFASLDGIALASVGLLFVASLVGLCLFAFAALVCNDVFGFWR